MDEAIQSIGMHPTEDKLLVAMKNGKWLLADVTDGSFDVITQQQDGNEQHDIIKFSPGNFLFDLFQKVFVLILPF